MFYYRAYNLNIISEIEIPLLPIIELMDIPDLKIILGKTPEKLMGGDVLAKVSNQSRPGEFLLTNPIANFYITDGKKVVVEVKDDHEWAFIRHYLLSRGMAVIARQRGWLPIHGSAIQVNGKAVIFAGNSGAGKSTTASFFVKKGYGFVADDICIFKKNEDNNYHVFPAYPNIRMWEDTIEMVGQDSFQVGENVRRGIQKFNVNPQIPFDLAPLSVSHIYFIHRSQKKINEVESLTKADALFCLLEHTYAKGQMDGMGGHKEQFEVFSYLLKDVKMKSVHRSLHSKSPETLIELIEHDFLSEV